MPKIVFEGVELDWLEGHSVIPAVFALAQIRLTRSHETWEHRDPYGYECA